jgi:hypothetical protein
MTPEQVSGLTLVSALVEANDRTLIVRDENGNYHFSGHIRNSKDVTRSLDALKDQSHYAELVKAEADTIGALFESVFRHAEFTGRSGTFFGYEGLGSIYWHMVSKLLLSVQETLIRTRSEPSLKKLMDRYADIRKGLSFNKSPDVYGAFPTDPYSHTPKDQGARQPGMTGLVKEEILTRQVELGFFIDHGALTFDFLFLKEDEFLAEPTVFTYFGIDGYQEQIDLIAGSLAYLICQVPVILHASNENCITLYFTDGSTQRVTGHVLDAVQSRHIFQRDGTIHHVIVSIAN